MRACHLFLACLLVVLVLFASNVRAHSVGAGRIIIYRAKTTPNSNALPKILPKHIPILPSTKLGHRRAKNKRQQKKKRYSKKSRSTYSKKSRSIHAKKHKNRQTMSGKEFKRALNNIKRILKDAKSTQTFPKSTVQQKTKSFTKWANKMAKSVQRKVSSLSSKKRTNQFTKKSFAKWAKRITKKINGYGKKVYRKQARRTYPCNKPFPRAA